MYTIYIIILKCSYWHVWILTMRVCTFLELATFLIILAKERCPCWSMHRIPCVEAFGGIGDSKVSTLVSHSLVTCEHIKTLKRQRYHKVRDVFIYFWCCGLNKWEPLVLVLHVVCKWILAVFWQVSIWYNKQYIWYDISFFINLIFLYL